MGGVRFSIMSLRCFNIALIWAKESSNSSIDNLRVPPELQQNPFSKKLKSWKKFVFYLLRADVRFFVSSSSLSQQLHKCSALMQLSESALSNLLYLESKSIARASSSSSKSISSPSSKSSFGKSRVSHSSFKSWNWQKNLRLKIRCF